ncbi:MAG TPA: hypothetical protein VF844_03940, partial [Ktedonobacteraceae bacterium]
SWSLDRAWTPGNRCSEAALMIVRLVSSKRAAYVLARSVTVVFTQHALTLLGRSFDSDWSRQN